MKKIKINNISYAKGDIINVSDSIFKDLSKSGVAKLFIKNEIEE